MKIIEIKEFHYRIKKQNMRKTNRVKNRVTFNVDKESKKRHMTRRNKNEKDAKNRTINASLRIKNRTLTPMTT